MTTAPITITVTYRTQAYHCRLKGISASSTMSPEAAAQRLADKVFGQGTHRVRMLRDCSFHAPGEWAIEPATLPEKLAAASVRITLADDGHYYIDVRKRTGAAFRADSRKGNIDDAMERARFVLAKEGAASC